MTLVFNLMLGRGRGGLERMAAEYHRMLAARGYDVITLGHPESWMRKQLPEGARFIATGAFTDFDPRTHVALSRAVRRYQPAAVLAIGNRAMRYAVRLQGPKRIGVLQNLRFRPLIADFDGTIAVSQGVADAARRLVPGLKVEVVPNVVPLEVSAERAPRRTPLRLGALGRLHPNKGFDLLIEALGDPMLASRDWTLDIGGDGPQSEELAACVARHGLGERVRFLGWIDDTAAFLDSVDVLAMPSRVEPFGIVLVEALARSVPVVVSDTDGSRDIVTDGREALVVPCGDMGALTAAILRLVDDDALARTLGERGRLRVMDGFGPEAVGPQLTRALETILNAPPPAPA